MLYSSFRPLYLYTFASVRVTRTSKATRTTTIRTVANSLPENEAILLTFLISKRYIPHTDLRNNFVSSEYFREADIREGGGVDTKKGSLLRPFVLVAGAGLEPTTFGL